MTPQTNTIKHMAEDFKTRLEWSKTFINPLNKAYQYDKRGDIRSTKEI